MTDELIHHRVPWTTKEVVEFASLEWVLWRNHHHLLTSIGNMAPPETEKNYYR